MAVVAGLYRTCVIDTVLEHSPAEQVRRPHVLAESPTLGLAHLQFEAMVATARTSANRNDFAFCLDDNAASIKTIERCGGVLDRVVDDGHGLVRHYWISL